ncbi:GMC oxidoreductase [Leptospira sp. GIMC2001]|uniref:GMC oxidoreductase n=1 Tax=Leptospira sp. GIMC2001 TaxID=1513297 RepID=UPI00234B5225|nr:GMC oxidoreductase [Leptospira sp. GIMC2001]WCL51271.1 GMC oxidoreductase [Leptospira sp. GIMC2001]
MVHYKNLVIGSGPSAYGAVLGLIARDEKVIVFDIGIDFEKSLFEFKESVKNEIRNKGTVSENTLEQFRSSSNASSSGVPIKRFFTSDYAYREHNNSINVKKLNVQATPSYAKGGFSAVWGSSIMPFSAKELETWSIDIEQLNFAYKQIIKNLPVSIENDDLAIEFPLFRDDFSNLEISKQANSLYNRLIRNKLFLNKKGITFGKSRLAVKANDCTYCGLCLYGCPEDLIFNSWNAINRLAKDEKIEYKSNSEIVKFKEFDNHVVVTIKDLVSGNIFEVSTERVYLAAGAISTAKIILESRENYNEEIQIKDSQYFIVPFISFFGSKGIFKEKFHSMSQFYLEVKDENISNFNMHLQFYGYNDLLYTAVKNIFGFLFFLVKPFLPFIFSRIFIIQGYIHSNESQSFSLELNEKMGEKSLILRKNKNISSYILIKKLMKKLFLLSRKLGGIVFFPALKISEPGFGNHYGSSFPMEKQPNLNQSDLYGRPFGFKRVHIVDSSVLPSISANTITLTVMANAYRISNRTKDLI